MKKSLMLIAGLLVSSISVGQIKIVDDSFTPNLKEINYIERPFDISAIFVQYDGQENDLKRYHAQGETIYMLDSLKAFRLNHKENTVEHVFMEKGRYYTCKYVMYTMEELTGLYNELMDINARNPYSNAKSVYESLRNIISDGSTIKDLKMRYHNKWIYCVKPLLYIFADKDDNEYYIYGNDLKPKDYIAVKFYENICNIIKGQQVALAIDAGNNAPDYISNILKKVVWRDAITNTPLVDIRLSAMALTIDKKRDNQLDLFKYFDFTCTDVIIKDKKMFAVLQTGENTFTVELKMKEYQGSKCGPYSSVINVAIANKHVILLPKSVYDKALIIFRETVREEEARIEAEKKAEKQRKIAEEQKRLQRQQYLISKYGAEDGKLISEHKITLNMTMEMCQESWGIPNNKRTRRTHDGRYDIWIYMDSELYFSNDRLVEIVTYK